MTRLSSYFLPTVREAPADAEALSHKLLVRAGMVRQLAAGLWTFLPAGWRVHRRVGQIRRGGVKANGGQGKLLAGLPPADPRRPAPPHKHDELFKRNDPRGAH